MNGQATLRLLVVEDNELNRELLDRRLTRRGYRIWTAVTGTEVADRVSELDPDVILMDMNLPGITGWEATKKLRDRGCATPIIALTAHALCDERERALAAGCDDYLTKPIDFDRLVGAIEKQRSPRRSSSLPPPLSGPAAAAEPTSVPELALAARILRDHAHGLRNRLWSLTCALDLIRAGEHGEGMPDLEAGLTELTELANAWSLTAGALGAHKPAVVSAAAVAAALGAPAPANPAVCTELVIGELRVVIQVLESASKVAGPGLAVRGYGDRVVIDIADPDGAYAAAATRSPTPELLERLGAAAAPSRDSLRITLPPARGKR